MLKSAAVMGVPNTAANRADMPHMVMRLALLPSRWNTRLKQAAAPAPQPAEIAAPQPAEPAAPRQMEYEPPAYVNVMEVLVREKAEKYMRASGMCCCDHCMVDVMAYTLSHLPPKYVVMSKGEMIPKLTFYEVQHSSDITTQLMQACKIVAKSPHHGRV